MGTLQSPPFLQKMLKYEFLQKYRRQILHAVITLFNISYFFGKRKLYAFLFHKKFLSKCVVKKKDAAVKLRKNGTKRSRLLLPKSAYANIEIEGNE